MELIGRNPGWAGKDIIFMERQRFASRALEHHYTIKTCQCTLSLFGLGFVLCIDVFGVRLAR